jgi:hypothetical protein
MNLKESLKNIIRNVLLEEDRVTIEIMKNPESAHDYGSMFGQDVEPKGTYVLKKDEGVSVLPGWMVGIANLKKPLYIDVNENTLISYKRALSKKYKARGKRLTEKLMDEGYDSLITRFDDGHYGEIVLFPNAHFTLNKQ